MSSTVGSLPVAGHGGWLHRAAPLACGAAGCAAAAYVALNDPSAAASTFPACAFRLTTGLWCPGCGLTRGFHHLFRADVAAAVASNVFVPLVLIALIYGWLRWTRHAFGRRQWVLPAAVVRASWTVLPVAVVVYGVARNLPPLRALAP